MDLDNQNIIIDDTNYKNFDSKTIKKFVKDKALRAKYLTYYRNYRYYINTREKQLKKSYCEICNCNVVKIKRHNNSKAHLRLLQLKEQPKEQNTEQISEQLAQQE